MFNLIDVTTGQVIHASNSIDVLKKLSVKYRVISGIKSKLLIKNVQSKTYILI